MESSYHYNHYIAPFYLSMLVNGKRKWHDALRCRYEEFVNSVVNTMPKEHTEIVPHTAIVVGGSGLDPL